MKTMKKIVAILAVALMLCSILPLSVFAADAETIKYTISNYPAGTQYKAEAHKLDDYLTVHTNTRCHFTTELRIYAPSGSVNGEVILASTRELTTVVLNAGNKASTLTVSTSPDNSTWTQHSTLSVASSYKDLSISNLPAGTKYVKLVNGSGQVRVKYITVSYAADAPEEPEVPSDCEHEWELISTTAATCTAAGEEYYECSGCGESKTEAIAALGHSYSEAVETVAPDCVNAGEKESTCANCGDVKTETIPALGHDFSESDICADCGAEKPLNATITFDADKTQRTEYTTTVQKWENDGLTLTNNKASSTTNIGDYSNPGRFYKSSQIIIEFPAMTSLIIDATGIGSDYLWDTTLNNAGLSFTVENKVYTITFAEPTDSITLTAANQARANSITAYGAKKACEHEFDNNCDNECNNCGEANPDYAEHVYDHEFDVDCNECGAVRAVAGPVSYIGKSVSDDCNGYAVLFQADVEGIAVKFGTFVQADYTNATYNGYKLLELGVVASNGKSETTIKGERMYELEDGVAKFAFRIVNIPADKLDTEITMTPYYVVESDGVATTISGEAVIGSYAAVAG